MKNTLFMNKKYNYSFLSITRKYLDNIKTSRCRVGMRVVNGKLLIQLEWPYILLITINRHQICHSTLFITIYNCMCE